MFESDWFLTAPFDLSDYQELVIGQVKSPMKIK